MSVNPLLDEKMERISSGPCKIVLSRGQTTLLDYDDFIKFGKLKWSATKKPGKNIYYAKRGVRQRDGRIKTIILHREIMKAPRHMTVDHINHDTLDNRKSNLRVCTKAQNCLNRMGAQRNSISGVRGVWWHKNGWVARITYRKKFICSKRFKSKTKAAAYCKAAIKKYLTIRAKEQSREN